jgi:hypothetical protein
MTIDVTGLVPFEEHLRTLAHHGEVSPATPGPTLIT